MKKIVKKPLLYSCLVVQNAGSFRVALFPRKSKLVAVLVNRDDGKLIIFIYLYIQYYVYIVMYIFIMYIFMKMLLWI